VDILSRGTSRWYSNWASDFTLLPNIQAPAWAPGHLQKAGSRLRRPHLARVGTVEGHDVLLLSSRITRLPHIQAQQPYPSTPSGNPSNPSSNWTPQQLSAIDTSVYCPAVKIRSSICSVL